MLIFFLLLVCAIEVSARSYYAVTSVVGRGNEEGENIAPTSSYIDNPLGIWGDMYGRVYFTTSYRVRRVTQSSNIIASIAGNGVSQDSGLGGLASEASLNSPLSLFVTSVGSVYIGDFFPNGGDTTGVVKKIDLSGYIDVFCGYGNSDDSSITDPLSFELQKPYGVWGDSSETIYIVDLCSVFKVKNGAISLVAGRIRTCGDIFDGELATDAILSSPNHVWVDSNENMYILQQFNSAIRKVDGSTNIISKYAGGGSLYDDNINAAFAAIDFPQCLVGFQDNLYVCTGTKVRKISTVTMNINTVAGGGTLAVGAATSVNMSPMGVWFDSTGVWYITDALNNAILKVNSNSVVSILAGGNNVIYSGDGGPASLASIYYPRDMWVNSASDIYVADTYNSAVRKVDHSTQIITSLGGNSYTTADSTRPSGPATSMSMGYPYFVWGDSLNSALYVADNFNNVVISITVASGYANVIAGTFVGATTGNGGKASSAAVNSPRSLMADSVGRLYISQSNYIRRIDTSNIIQTLAGSGLGTGSGIPATSSLLSNNWNMWVNSIGDYYVWESGWVEKIAISTGQVSIILGGGSSIIWDGIAPSDAFVDGMYDSQGLWGDTTGVLYLSDHNMAAVYCISLSSVVEVIAGDRGLNMYGLDSHDALDPGYLLNPKGIMVDSVGSVYFTEESRIRKLTINVPSFAPTSQPTNPTGQPTRQPTSQPSSQPTKQPTSQPSAKPSRQPSSQPSMQPSVQPSNQPSRQPSGQPSGQPSARPSRQPSAKPTYQPSSQPTIQPSTQPTSHPTRQPTRQPSSQPSNQPSTQPITAPTRQPTVQPSTRPSVHPSTRPSAHPLTHPTGQPSCQPSSHPSSQPTRQPSSLPTKQPISLPSGQPSRQPINGPSGQPSSQPSSQPSKQPSSQPSCKPSGKPRAGPSGQPSGRPSSRPNAIPTSQPSAQPTGRPSSQPSVRPSVHPTSQPTQQPSSRPTAKPYASPSNQPSSQPTKQPILTPTSQPSDSPSTRPTCSPSVIPSSQPTFQPTQHPTNRPSSHPSVHPTNQPSTQPSSGPWSCPSIRPSSVPTTNPSGQPSGQPSIQPSGQPSGQPLSQPTSTPTVHPSRRHTSLPTPVPTLAPSMLPSCQPNSGSSAVPTQKARAGPSIKPSIIPTAVPSKKPILLPSRTPTAVPTSSIGLQFNVTNVFTSNVTIAVHVSEQSVVYCAAYLSSQIYSITSIVMDGVSTTVQSQGNLVITGLVGVTSYNVLCLAQSHGFTTSLLDATRLRVQVTTKCCRKVEVTISKAVILADQVALNFVSVISEQPLVGVIVQSFITRNTSRLNGSLVPSVWDATLQSSNTLTSSVSSLSAGHYECHVTLSGSDVYSFTTGVLSTHWSIPFSVVTAYSPAAPVLLSATYSSDGTYVVIIFDSNTNRGNISTSFPCSMLFNFSCVTSSRCQWVTSAVINAFVSTEGDCAIVGDTLTLLPSAVILAECMASSGCIQPSTPSVSRSLVIAAPSQAITPVVVVSAPATIGSCDSLTLDLTTSTGHGGREWSSYLVVAQYGPAVLQAFLDSEYALFPPTPIPEYLLEKGTTYSFIVTLCNFLGKCGTASYQVNVQPAHVPVILIGGPLNRNVLRKNELSIGSRAAVASCSGLNITSGLRYVWSVFVGNNNQTQLITTSLDPSRLRLPPYSLSVGVVYTMSLTVTYEETHRATSAVVNVIVSHGSIVAKMSCGSSLSVLPGAALIIDASSSYDEDVSGITSGLLFKWTCTQTNPTLADTCSNIFSITSNLTSNGFGFSAMTSATSATATVSVVVSDPSTSRSAFASVFVTVSQSNSPVVSLTSSAIDNVINRRQSLILIGSIQLPPNSRCNATWSVNDTSLVDLRALSQTSTVASVFPTTSSAAVRNVYLVLAGNSLPAFAWSGSFSLSCRLLSGHANTASIAITVNSPPNPGVFLVWPANGTVGYWLFSATRWTDLDLPLQYQFGFTSNSGVNTIILSKTEFPYGTALLPPGPAALNYSVVCFVNVFDAYQNNATAFRLVQVLPTTLTIQSALTNSGATLDQIKQTAAFVTSMINTVNCSAAPNCSSLHRAPCSVAPNTCGACWSGYVGDAGNANSYCSSGAQAALQALGVPKTCPSDCSSHGVCQFVNINSGITVADCLVGNSQCTAQCSCAVYFYGADCSSTVNQMELLKAARNQVIDLIAGLLRKEDADEQSVEAWINSMNDVSVVQSQLDSTAIQSIFNASTAYLSLGYAVGISTVSTLGVLSSVDNAAAAAKLNGITGTSVGSAVGSLLLQFQSYAGSMMVPSQVALQLIYSQFRTVIDVPSVQQLLSSSATNTSSVPVVSVTESTPLTDLEVVLNQSPAVIVAPLVATAEGTTSSINSNNHNSTFQVSVSTVVASVILPHVNASIVSNVVTATFSTSPSTIGSINISIPYAQTMVLVSSPLSVVSIEVRNVTCALGSVLMQNHTCPDGAVLSIACNGSEVGRKAQRCPVRYVQPVCNAVMGSSVTVSSCSVLGYTNASISCACPTTSNTSVIHSDGSYSVSYVVMLQTVEKSFVATLSSAEGLNEDTLNKGWKCLTTMGVFVSFVLIALVWSNFMDGYESEFNSRISAKVSPKAVAAKNSWIHMQNRLTNNKLMQVRSSNSNKGFQRNRDLVLIESSLPQIFRSQGMTYKIIKELKQHHRWFAIVFFYCKYFPRVLRVVSLFTNIVIMLFIQSLTYSLTNADNGTCETYTTQATCLGPRSPYATGESMCQWTAEGRCKYERPDGKVKIIVFVAIFSALISTPLALLVDWIVNHILAAPSEVRVPSSKKSFAQIVPVDGFARMVDSENVLQTTRARTRTRTSSGDETNADAAPVVTQASKMVNLAQAQTALRVMTNELQEYRTRLSIEERKDFDDLWGLDSGGNFYTTETKQKWWNWFKKSIDVKKMVLEDLCSVIAATSAEKQRFFRDQTGDARGKRMLYLFQKDLLPGIQGQMLDAKFKRDNVQPKATRREFKYLAWVFIALLNGGMLFYILLFALKESEQQQSAWFKSFVLWLCLEIFLVSTTIVLLTHVVIPLWTMKDVNRIKQTLLNSLSEFRENIVYKHGLSPRAAVKFNAAQYLFVSSQMAKEFPKLKESKIIARFSTPWPKRSYQHVSDVSKQYSKKFSAIIRSLGLVLIYFLTSALSLPPHLQDMIIHSITTVALGYLVLVHVELFHIFPLLAFVPVILIGVMVHFWINSGKASALKDLKVLQRRRQSTVLHSDSKDNETAKETPLMMSDFLKAGQVERQQHITRRQSIQKGYVTIEQLKALHGSYDEEEESEENEDVEGVWSDSVSDGSVPSVGNILEWNVEDSHSDESDEDHVIEHVNGEFGVEGVVAVQQESDASVGTDVIDQLLDEIGEEKVNDDHLV